MVDCSQLVSLNSNAAHLWKFSLLKIDFHKVDQQMKKRNGRSFETGHSRILKSNLYIYTLTI